MLTFDDIKNNITKVMSIINSEIFTDSTITMMTDEYIKKSVEDKLLQIVLFNEGVVSLSEDAGELSKAMLRSSLSDEDITFILNASLKVSTINVSIGSSNAPNSQVESTPEEANKLIKAKLETMCSIENLISIIKRHKGTSRVTAATSYEALAAAAMQKQAGGPGEPERDLLSVERPLKLNLDYIDLTKCKNSQLFDLLNGLMALDSNSSLTLEIPKNILTSNVLEFITTDLASVCDQSVIEAKQSAKNSVIFTAEQDPYKSLFDTL